MHLALKHYFNHKVGEVQAIDPSSRPPGMIGNNKFNRFLHIMKSHKTNLDGKILSDFEKSKILKDKGELKLSKSLKNNAIRLAILSVSFGVLSQTLNEVILGRSIYNSKDVLEESREDGYGIVLDLAWKLANNSVNFNYYDMDNLIKLTPGKFLLHQNPAISEVDSWRRTLTSEPTRLLEDLLKKLPVASDITKGIEGWDDVQATNEKYKKKRFKKLNP
jgi:hypothetical protein